MEDVHGKYIFFYYSNSSPKLLTQSLLNSIFCSTADCQFSYLNLQRKYISFKFAPDYTI